jgi:hypothetical protein
VVAPRQTVRAANGHLNGQTHSVTVLLAAERGVLGALLLDQAVIAHIGELCASDFYLRKHGLIFAAIVDAHGAGTRVDPTVIGDMLDSRGQLAEIGGVDELHNLLDPENVVHTANISYHAAIVRERAKRRELANVVREIALSNEDGADVAEVVENLRDRLDHIAPRAPVAQSAIGVAFQAMEAGSLSIAPPARQWLVRHPNGDGLLPLGKAGAICAEGGAGKTIALLQLAVCFATGRPWLDHFEVVDRRGKVALMLGEEDREEIHRRLYNVCEALRLSDAERGFVERRVIAVPLAGDPCALLTLDAGAMPRETPELETLRRLLQQNADADGWALLALDPLARFAGIDVEQDNSLATRFVQAVESLTAAPGGPTVLVAHHSSKAARTEGRVDSRGVTGVTDGLRWVATFRTDGDRVAFRQVKSNYSVPMPEELRLSRGPNGILSVVTADQTAAAERAEQIARDDELEALAVRAVEAVERLGGVLKGSWRPSRRCWVPAPRPRAPAWHSPKPAAGSRSPGRRGRRRSRPHRTGAPPLPPVPPGTRDAIPAAAGTRPNTSGDATGRGTRRGRISRDGPRHLHRSAAARAHRRLAVPRRPGRPRPGARRRQPGRAAPQRRRLRARRDRAD